MIWTVMQVALGGALGAVARFGATQGLARALGPDFPYGTAFVNILGSFLMGLAFVWLAARGLTQHAPLLMAGVLGGFTTFSAFSLDAVTLWQRDAVLAGVYVAGSVGLSILALTVGMAAGRVLA
jgi:CrcB protein